VPLGSFICVTGISHLYQRQDQKLSEKNTADCRPPLPTVTAYYFKAFENNKGKYSLGYQHIINRYYML